MEFLIGISASVVGEIAKYTVAPVARQLGYSFCYKRNIENLKNQMNELDCKKTAIDRQVEEARRNGKEIEAYVLNWLNEVELRSEDTKDILKDENHMKESYSCSWSFQRLMLQDQLSRKAKKTTQKIATEIQKVDTLGAISYHPIVESSFQTKGFQDFATTMFSLQEIVRALRDPSIGMIGVYGTGRVGKTTLVKEVARRAKEEELFSEVVMVTISQSFDVKNIQQEIAEKLGLRIYETSISVRADRLECRLRRENKILIILDDIWEKLNLEDIGICFKGDQRGCKILLVSRDRYVLCNLMGVEKDFQVNVLSDSDAMKLFNHFVGDTINENPDFQRLATAVVGECGGLPIAIETIACALKNRPICVWEDALQQVKRSPKEVYGKAYSTIKTSYDFLRSEEKSILLLCSLHIEDASIDVERLTHIYGASCDFFHEMDTLEEARNRVKTLVDRLKAHCLLLDGDYDGTVKMHDTVRDIIVSIAAEDKRMHCFTNITKLEGFLDRGKMKDSTAISILDYEFCKLPEELSCLELEVFFVSKNHKQKIPRDHDHRPMLIPEKCFGAAKELRALCMDSFILESLPSSFSSLQNLQTLSLQGCKLESIALIGELKNLIVLDLSHSDFRQLPEQIGRLTGLRLLNLNGCMVLRVVQPNVISSLVKLEELYMDRTYVEWSDVDGNGGNASLRELKDLAKLRVLYITIQDKTVVPEDLFSETLERYNITIGRFIKRRFSKIESSRLLRIEYCGSSLLRQRGFQTLMKRCEVLHAGRLDVDSNFCESTQMVSHI